MVYLISFGKTPVSIHIIFKLDYLKFKLGSIQEIQGKGLVPAYIMFILNESSNSVFDFMTII